MASSAEHSRRFRQRNYARRIRWRGMWIAPVREHGTLHVYLNHGCRCPECRNASRERQRARRGQA